MAFSWLQSLLVSPHGMGLGGMELACGKLALVGGMGLVQGGMGQELGRGMELARGGMELELVRGMGLVRDGMGLRRGVGQRRGVGLLRGGDEQRHGRQRSRPDRQKGRRQRTGKEILLENHTLI